MPLDRDHIAELLEPYISSPHNLNVDWQRVFGQLASYLNLLVKWNNRMNLTAIRSPEEMVQRHFGESLFAGMHVVPCESLLDFGSGAGFPGLPIQILRPNLAVTLAEARQKKASFLREVVRSLDLPTEIWAGRVEQMPADRQFSVVTLRAVDVMGEAVAAASQRAADRLIVLGTQDAAYPGLTEEFSGPAITAIPQSSDGALMVYTRRER